MTTTQEIGFAMTNGDFAEALLERRESAFLGSFRYVQADGACRVSSATLPKRTAALAFEALLNAVRNIASARGTALDVIENFLEAQLFDRDAQLATICRQGSAATVFVGGQ